MSDQTNPRKGWLSMGPVGFAIIAGIASVGVTIFGLVSTVLSAKEQEKQGREQIRLLKTQLAKVEETLAMLTGGDSYCFLRPWNSSPGFLTLVLECRGKYPMADVRVTLTDESLIEEVDSRTQAIMREAHARAAQILASADGEQRAVENAREETKSILADANAKAMAEVGARTNDMIRTLVLDTPIPPGVDQVRRELVMPYSGGARRLDVDVWARNGRSRQKLLIKEHKSGVGHVTWAFVVYRANESGDAVGKRLLRHVDVNFSDEIHSLWTIRSLPV